MSSKILNIIKEKLKKMYEEGIEINSTKEIQNVLIEINLSEINLEEEELEIKNYYNNVIFENYHARLKIEQDHYNFLEYALKHKISEIQYFFKNEDITSRKFIVFSGDCINCLNLLIRKDFNLLNVFMRSSDCLRLLPMDILYSIKIFKNVLNRHCIELKERDKISFWITSMHFYLRDKKLVEKIIK